MCKGFEGNTFYCAERRLKWQSFKLESLFERGRERIFQFGFVWGVFLVFFFFEREGNGSPSASISQIKTHSWLVDDSSSGPSRPAVRNLLQVLALPWSVLYPVPATSLHTKH